MSVPSCKHPHRGPQILENLAQLTYRTTTSPRQAHQCLGIALLGCIVEVGSVGFRV